MLGLLEVVGLAGHFIWSIGRLRKGIKVRQIKEYDATYRDFVISNIDKVL